MTMMKREAKNNNCYLLSELNFIPFATCRKKNIKNKIFIYFGINLVFITSWLK